MKRLDLDYLIVAALLMSGLYVLLTGLLMDLLGSTGFYFHSYVGYVCTALAGLHLALNWNRVAAYLRRRVRQRPYASLLPKRRNGLRRSRRGIIVSMLAAIGGFAAGWLMARNQVSGIPDGVTDMGQVYHQWSKPGAALLLGTLLSWGQPTARYKTYPQTDRIGLPDPHGNLGMDLNDVIERRRSRRNYRRQSLSLADLSRLLHASSGITDPVRQHRAAPSAGALYPIETYVVVHNVQGLERGLYHFAVQEHALEPLLARDLRAKTIAAGVGQEMLGQAAGCFVYSAIFQRTRWKYRERSYRYILLEAGHMGQNLYLAATAAGLGACAVGAFLDDQLNALLGLDGQDEAALYLIAVGQL